MAQARSPWTPKDPWWVRDNLREAIDRTREAGCRGPGAHRSGKLRMGRRSYPYHERMSPEGPGVRPCRSNC